LKKAVSNKDLNGTTEAKRQHAELENSSTHYSLLLQSFCVYSHALKFSQLVDSK